jgi:hypothetical protein
VSRIVNIDKLDKLAKALDNRIKVSAEELIVIINSVKDMFGGRSIVYLSQLEYDSLSEEEKNDETKSYFVTDAEDLSHEHDNKEFLDSLSQMTLDDINSEISMVEAMLGGRSLVYLTQAEYELLSEDEKSSESILYVITDMEQAYHTHENAEFLAKLTEGNVHADSVNGYKIWVGTTLELEEIEEKDPFTVYFEIEDEDEEVVSVGDSIVQLTPNNGKLQLTTDKYQKAVLSESSISIIMPDMTGVDGVVEFCVILTKDLYSEQDEFIYIDFEDLDVRTPLGHTRELMSDHLYKLDVMYTGEAWMVKCTEYSNFR